MKMNVTSNPVALRAPYFAKLTMLAAEKKMNPSKKMPNGKRRKYGGIEIMRVPR